MIIDLTVKNYRSIKDEQTLSMNAEYPKTHLLGNLATTDNEKVNILKTAGVYGANASGKSNILLAFRALDYIIARSGDLKEGESIPGYAPYCLCKETENAPTSFEIEFLSTDGIRYLYAVSYNKYEIVTESLDFYPTRQKANLFKRNEGDTWETISFGSRYKGGTKRIPFFKNNSYLSKAGNNAAASDRIRSVYQYFTKLLHISPTSDLYTKPILAKRSFLPQIAEFLSHTDTGIVQIDRKRNTKLDKYISGLTFTLPDEVRERIIDQNQYTYEFSHATDDGNLVKLKLTDESLGTQKLFNFLPLLITAFSIGTILIMDELDSSFHPHLAELIIKLFHDPKVNKNNAQLIFSTHDINLMSPNLMRRDQVWFTEKQDGATSLYSLDEFDKSSVKSNSPYGHWYDEGRFGALPRINYSMIAAVLSSEIVIDDDLEDSDLPAAEEKNA